jgi:orotate phosphoribosyltransferase
VQILGAELADPISKLKVDVVCGPLVEGAFVALMVAPGFAAPEYCMVLWLRTGWDSKDRVSVYTEQKDGSSR